MLQHAASAMMGNAYPPFTLGQSTATVGGSDSSTTVTSGSVAAQPSGGSGIWETPVWTRLSGSSAIVPTAPGSLTTAFQATGMSIGTISAVFDCAVADKVTGQTLHIQVTVTLTRGYPALSVSTPADIFVQTPSSSEIVVSGSTSVSYSGGVGPFVVSWAKRPQDDYVISPSGTSCGASRALAPTGGVQGVLSVTVLDQGTGQSVTRSCNVVLINNGTPAPPLTVSVDYAQVEGFSDSGDPVTSAATMTASGAVGAVTWNWTRVSGSGSPISPSSQSTQFGTYMNYNGTETGSFQGTATDSLGRTSPPVTVAATFRNHFYTGPFN